MPTPLFQRDVAGRRVTVVATDRADGDVHPDRVGPDQLVARQLQTTGARWAMLDEVHGVEVVRVDAAPVDGVLAGVGDVIVTDRTDVQIAVWTADCAPILLFADDGTVVGAHGGWKGLADGVVDVAVAEAQRNGGRVVASVVGPAIGPCCYEFGLDELQAVAAGVHATTEAIGGRTRTGSLALDVGAAVGAALEFHDIAIDVAGPCTGCDARWFSHRVRADAGRHATVAIREAAAR